MPLFVEKFALPHKMYESDSKQAHLHVDPPHRLVHLPVAVEHDQAVDRQTILTVHAYVCNCEVIIESMFNPHDCN